MAPKSIILLDSNAYLRIADSFHPLLGESFGEEGYVLYLIPEFQKEFNKSQRLKNKFGWVNQPEYVENRSNLLKRTREQSNQIDLTYSYLWEYNISEGLGASRVDVKALSYGLVLGLPVVTDDRDMTQLGRAFGVEMWGLLDLLKIMLAAGHIDPQKIKTLVSYLEYNNDLPFPAFKQIVMKLIR